MELKGKITVQPDSISLTCCESRPKIFIGKIDLYEWLWSKGNMSPPNSREDWDYESKPEGPQDTSCAWQIRYVTQKKRFYDVDFESAAANIIETSLNSDLVTGCYSEWTCGVGAFDFIISGGHSIFNELASHEGEWIWIKFN